MRSSLTGSIAGVCRRASETRSTDASAVSALAAEALALPAHLGSVALFAPCADGALLGEALSAALEFCASPSAALLVYAEPTPALNSLARRLALCRALPERALYVDPCRFVQDFGEVVDFLHERARKARPPGAHDAPKLARLAGELRAVDVDRVLALCAVLKLQPRPVWARVLAAPCADGRPLAHALRVALEREPDGSLLALLQYTQPCAANVALAQRLARRRDCVDAAVALICIHGAKLDDVEHARALAHDMPGVLEVLNDLH